ncbi:hypothetical protein GCM10009567_02420 [Rothia amarae]
MHGSSGCKKLFFKELLDGLELERRNRIQFLLDGTFALMISGIQDAITCEKVQVVSTKLLNIQVWF